MIPLRTHRVEVLNTGSELLYGQVLNTHLQFLANALWPLGLGIHRQTTVPDGAVIRDALLESFLRADIVFVTGGLGPTTDDLTRETTAELLALPLEHDPAIEALIRARLGQRNIPITERVLRQAMRPAGAVILANHFGTAPGLYLPPAPVAALEGRPSPHLFLLPGPPRELHPMVENEVLPLLRPLVHKDTAPGMRSWRIVGVPESLVEEAVGEKLLSLQVELGYCARQGEVDVRVLGTTSQLHQAGDILQQALGPHILPEGIRTLEEFVVRELVRRNERLATVESCTGGALANRITHVPGSSAMFGFGFVTYANEAKAALGVPKHLIEAHGAVSAEVAGALALSALRASGAHYALATTGIAGPGGGSPEKPTGTVFLALASSDGVQVERHFFQTDRLSFKNLATQRALLMLRARLQAHPQSTQHAPHSPFPLSAPLPSGGNTAS